MYNPDSEFVNHNSYFFDNSKDENPFGNLFLLLLWLNWKFSNLFPSILNTDIPELSEIHNSIFSNNYR